MSHGAAQQEKLRNATESNLDKAVAKRCKTKLGKTKRHLAQQHATLRCGTK
jgi:hypothetical protein